MENSQNLTRKKEQAEAACLLLTRLSVLSGGLINNLARIYYMNTDCDTYTKQMLEELNEEISNYLSKID